MAASPATPGTTGPSATDRGGQPLADAARAGSAPAAGVEQANEAVADQAGVPDGPNVGPSPREHLAAQGKAEPEQRRASGGGAADTGTDDPARAATAEVSPEEQELVDEQAQRDREASKKADPSSP